MERTIMRIYWGNINCQVCKAVNPTIKYMWCHVSSLKMEVFFTRKCFLRENELQKIMFFFFFSGANFETTPRFFAPIRYPKKRGPVWLWMDQSGCSGCSGCDAREVASTLWICKEGDPELKEHLDKLVLISCWCGWYGLVKPFFQQLPTKFSQHPKRRVQSIDEYRRVQTGIDGCIDGCIDGYRRVQEVCLTP